MRYIRRKISESIDVRKAVEFIEDNANQLELARLNNILGRGFDSGQVLLGFSELQNPDGGFPYADRKGFPSCLSNTAMALHILLELGLGDSEPARRTVEFFLTRQEADGSWPEHDKVAPLEPPFWDMPGDDRTTLWLTADIADLLLRSGLPKSNIGTAADFIIGHQGPDGKFMGYIHTTWMALSVFGGRSLDNVDVYSEALAFLENADIDEWDAASMAWCLDCMKAGDVGSESPLWNRLTSRLAHLQKEDGHWPSEEGEYLEPRDANSVLAALTDIMDF